MNRIARVARAFPKQLSKEALSAESLEACNRHYCLTPLPLLLSGSFFCSSVLPAPGALPLKPLVPGSFFSSPVLTAPG